MTKGEIRIRVHGSWVEESKREIDVMSQLITSPTVSAQVLTELFLVIIMIKASNVGTFLYYIIRKRKECNSQH